VQGRIGGDRLLQRSNRCATIGGRARERHHDLNPALSIGGIVCTLVDRRTNLSQAVERQIRNTYGDRVFETVIPMNTKLAESPAAGEPVRVYAPTVQKA
jgi:cellulose biosynthesis protein BcsQ